GGISAPARCLARSRTLARLGRAHRGRAGDVRASHQRSSPWRAAARVQKGWLPICRAGSGWAADGQRLASSGDIVTQVRWDHDREARTGVPEVIYGPGKTSAHLRQVFENTEELRMASRLSAEQMEVLKDLATI